MVSPRKFHHFSKTAKFNLGVFIILMVTFSSLLIYTNAIFNKFLYFMEFKPEDNPHLLKSINYTRLHLLVEGNPVDHNVLGAEMRQALYHMPLGFFGVPQFEDGYFPEHGVADPFSWTPDNYASPGWWNNLSDVRMYSLNHLGDSPWRSSLYLHAQCLRWAVYNREGNSAGVQAAEHQIARILDGYWIQTRASGIPGNLIRFALPNNTFGNNGEAPDNFNYYYGNMGPATTVATQWGTVENVEYDFSDWVVVGDTSRDQNVGFLFGIASIMNFVETIELRKRAGALLGEVVDNLIRNDWKVIEPLDGDINSLRTNGADMDGGPTASWELPPAFLRVAMEVNPSKYTRLYQESLTRLNFLMMQNNYNGYKNVWPSFYPVNLNWMVRFSWWYTDRNSGISKTYYDLLEDHYQAIKCLKNAFFQTLYLAFDPQNRNPDSAAASLSHYTHILLEINDSLARMADDYWNGFNVYQQPDYSELASYFEDNGLDYSNEADRLELLMDPVAERYSNNKFLKFLDDAVGWGELKGHTLWSLPFDWRTREDWIWQRSPFNLRIATPPSYDILREESLADFTAIYWWARYMNWIDAPNIALNITPQFVASNDVAQVWQGHGRLSEFCNSTSILEGIQK
ncbi:MAG: hypothetical protein JW776_14695 [Candidatus Lokiarchaeota archaeon]|nr:hypothetical protein [Candidatus Lokiarchaeota archaeon]